MTAARRRGHNEGTIGQRSDGRWEARVSQPEGGRKSIYGATREEVANRMKTMLAALAKGEAIPDDKITVGKFLEDWLEAATPALSARTAISYAQVVRDHLTPQIGGLRLSRLTPQRVQRMMGDLGRVGVTPQSVAYARVVLRIALGRAVKWGLVGRNVAALVDPPKVEDRRIQPLTPDQAKRLLTSLQDDPMRLFVLLAVTTGLRLGELLGLRWEDIDLEAGTLTVARQIQRLDGELREVDTKTASSRATIALEATTGAALCDHRNATGRIGGPVFATADGGPMDPSNVRRWWLKALKRAGLPHRRLHDLRHSTATFLLAAGVPTRVVQEILRHANYRTTAGTYQHVDLAMQREAMAKLGALLEDAR